MIFFNREDAYNALKEISGFLKTLDAHSPIPDLLDLIVSWKNKTLVEIISDIGAGNKEGHILLRLFYLSKVLLLNFDDFMICKVNTYIFKTFNVV